MRRPILASLLLMVTLSLIVLSAPAALAVPIPPASETTGGHPVIGTWLATGTVGPGRLTFAADGTVVLKGPLATLADPALTLVSDARGSWEPIGADAATFSAVQTFVHVSGPYLGTATIVGYLTVGDDGATFADDRGLSTITVRDGNGTIVSVRSAEITQPVLTASRIVETPTLINARAGAWRTSGQPGCSMCAYP